MADQRSVMKEYRMLEQRRSAGGLSPQDEARFAQLRDLVAPELDAAATRPGFDVNAAAARLRESLLPAGLRNRPPPVPEAAPPPAPAPEPQAAVATGLEAVWNAAPFAPLAEPAGVPADGLFDPGSLGLEEAAPAASWGEAGQAWDPNAAYDPNAPQAWDPNAQAAWDPNAQPYDPNAPQAWDPNAQAAWDPNAQPYDPNAPQAWDPNAQAAWDPNAQPYDPNAPQAWSEQPAEPYAVPYAEPAAGAAPEEPSWDVGAVATEEVVSPSDWETASPEAVPELPTEGAPSPEPSGWEPAPAEAATEPSAWEAIPAEPPLESPAWAVVPAEEAPPVEAAPGIALEEAPLETEAPAEPFAPETAFGEYDAPAPPPGDATALELEAGGEPAGGTAAWELSPPEEAQLPPEPELAAAPVEAGSYDELAAYEPPPQVDTLAPEDAQGLLAPLGAGQELTSDDDAFAQGFQLESNGSFGAAGAPAEPAWSEAPTAGEGEAWESAPALDLGAMGAAGEVSPIELGAAPEAAALPTEPEPEPLPAAAFAPEPTPVEPLEELEIEELPAVDVADIEELAAPPGEATAPVPIRIEGAHRVVVHTIEGMVKRGVVTDADLGAEAMALAPHAGAPAEALPTAGVKAIFFMLSPGEAAPAPEGRKVRVTFTDGRQIAGFSRDDTGAGVGFFMVPADTRTNTSRIWVYRAAVKDVAVSG